MNFTKNTIYTTYNNQDNTGKRTGADNDKTKKENSGDACGKVTSLFLFIYVNPIASTLHVRSEANDSTTAVIRRFPLGG